MSRRAFPSAHDLDARAEVTSVLTNGTDLRAGADRDLAERLLRDQQIREAIERFEKTAEEVGARRQLLGTSWKRRPRSS